MSEQNEKLNKLRDWLLSWELMDGGDKTKNTALLLACDQLFDPEENGEILELLAAQPAPRSGGERPDFGDIANEIVVVVFPSMDRDCAQKYVAQSKAILQRHFATAAPDAAGERPECRECNYPELSAIHGNGLGTHTFVVAPQPPEKAGAGECPKCGSREQGKMNEACWDKADSWHYRSVIFRDRADRLSPESNGIWPTPPPQGPQGPKIKSGRKCSICGSSRIPLDREETVFGACTFIQCPDPAHDYEREQEAMAKAYEAPQGTGREDAMGEIIQRHIAEGDSCVCEPGEPCKYHASHPVEGKARLEEWPHKRPYSITYGELPTPIQPLIEPHKWDNLNITEQRDWALSMIITLLDRPTLPDALTVILSEHWLTNMMCDHTAKTDTPVCFCGWVGKAEQNVGEAAKSWANHVASLGGKVKIPREREI